MSGRVRRVLHTLAVRWVEHDVAAGAAAIAFYSLFMLAPTLVFAITIGRWVLGDAAAQEELRGVLGHFLTPEYVDALVRTIAGKSSAVAGVPPLIATLFLLYGASATFAQVRRALNRILGFSADGLRAQIRATLLGRLLAVGFVIGVVLLELVVACLNVGLDWAEEQLAWRERLPVTLLHALGVLLSWVIVSVLFFGVLRYLPLGKPSWSAVWPGAVVGVLLFQAGKFALGLYLSNAAITSAYGSAGALVAILIWVYFSSQTLLLGAEVTRLRLDHAAR